MNRGAYAVNSGARSTESREEPEYRGWDRSAGPGVPFLGRACMVTVLRRWRLDPEGEPSDAE